MPILGLDGTEPSRKIQVPKVRDGRGNSRGGRCNSSNLYANIISEKYFI